VLFLDELPEFARTALEALREPLESGQITISRAARQAAFPARFRFQLVAAMNPCPCGYLGAFADTGKTCRCTPDGIARYRMRLSGPLLDRIDLQVEVSAVKPEALMAQADGEDSAAVAAARRRQMQRQSMPNAALDATRNDTLCRPDAAASRIAQSAAQRLNWSSRGLHRALKVVRTIAEPAGAETIAAAHVAEALQLRRSRSDATP
jgi:magnesium chelatase family protein